MTILATAPAVRLCLAAAIEARAAALGAVSVNEADLQWEQFDEAVSQLLDALSVSEQTGMLGLLEQLELSGVRADAIISAPTAVQAVPAGGAI